MYVKLVAVEAGIYLLTYEWSILPESIGMMVLVCGGLVVLMDFWNDGPPRRTQQFLSRAGRRLEGIVDRQERKAELKRIAMEELEADCGIYMPEDLKPEDRAWLRNQATIARG